MYSHFIKDLFSDFQHNSISGDLHVERVSHSLVGATSHAKQSFCIIQTVNFEVIGKQMYGNVMKPVFDGLFLSRILI